MRRRYSIPARQLTRRLTAALVGLCLAACETDTPSGPATGDDTAGGEVTVVIAAPDTKTRAVPTGDEIRTVRIYAYEHGVTNAAPVGYLMDNKGTGTYKMTLSRRGQLDFIALLNDDGAEAANGTPGITLNNTTTLGQLNDYRIGRQLVNYGNDEYAIPMSTLAGADGANRTFTITETTATQYVNLKATRAMSRLRLWFAKADMGDAEVKITSATLQQGPLSVQLMAEETRESLPYNATYFDNANASGITVVGSEVNVDSIIADPDRTILTTANTTLVGTAYMPENPHGSSNVHDDGLYDDQYDGTGTDDRLNSPYKLTVSYKAGTSNKTKDIYLPVVKRNQTVNVFGLLRGEEVTLYVRVADWEVENVTLDDYPTYSDCALAEGRTEYSTTAEYYEITQEGSTTETEKQLNAAFACTFNMTAPDSLKFTPVLTGAGEARFKLKVYRDKTEITDDTDWVAGKGTYTIYVIPTEPYDKEHPEMNTVDLLITTATWAGTNDPLLINLDRHWNKDDNPLEDRIRITIKETEETTTP